MMLTTKQSQLLEYLRSRDPSGPSPSFREMAGALGLSSVSGVHRMMQALEERGYVRRLPRRARAVEVVDRPAEGVRHSTPLEHALGKLTGSGLSDPKAYQDALAAIGVAARANGISLDMVRSSLER